MDVGSKIREARKSKGLSQIEVAKTAKIAVNSLRLYESNKRQPRIEQLGAIASALEVDLNALLPDDVLFMMNVRKLADEANSKTDACEAALRDSLSFLPVGEYVDFVNCIAELSFEEKRKLHDYAKQLKAQRGGEHQEGE